ncbi:MAG: glucosyltransferase domain-containing protein [Clostridia bacterium]|nr:glucosyltransferase domain-containing protein [Clostridia bacterium]
MAPEKASKALSPLWAENKARGRAILICALLSGVIAHGTGLFNKLSYHDDILALFGVGTTLTSGRWMLHVMGVLEIMLFGDGHYSLPIMNGFFSILCVAGAAMLLADLLSIRRRGLCAALGGLMVVFPVMTAYFGFNYTMPYYMLAMLMMVAAGWLICRDLPWWAKLPAIVLGGCSVGTYQAFLPMLLTIILLHDMRRLSEREESLPAFFRQVALQIVFVAGVMVFYAAANRFFLNKFQMELSDYKGVNQVTSTSLSVYLQRALDGYREFFIPARNVSYDMYPMHLHYVYLLMLGIDAALGVRLILKTWMSGLRAKAALLFLLLLLFPLGCNFIFVMCEGVHGLMTYGQVMQFALLIWLLDRVEIQAPRPRKMLSAAAAVMLGLTGVMYCRFDNQCYMRATFEQQEAISFFSTLITRIQSTPDYHPDRPVAFLNAGEIESPSIYHMDELDFIELNPYGDNLTEYLNAYSWDLFMERWCGYYPQPYWGPELSDLPEVLAMPHYPEAGSIQVINDVLVVKF